jgi:hypothetical protein
MTQGTDAEINVFQFTKNSAANNNFINYIPA